MELHHKLRRDPNWHPNACNICGGMGHQAANCKTGTIPWREVFGDEAFVVRKPVYWTDIERTRQARIVDHASLKEDAVKYAKDRCVQLGMTYEAVQQAAAASEAVDVEAMLAKRREEAEEQARRDKRAADPTADIPEGWAVAYDAKGKPYYWHTKTQKVQWNKPAADTPIQ